LASAIRDGRHPEVRLIGRRQDHVLEGDVLFRDGVVDAPRHRGDVEVRHGAVGLGIEIDKERRLAAQRQRSGEIDRGRGLTHAAFLICDGNNHGVARRF